MTALRSPLVLAVAAWFAGCGPGELGRSDDEGTAMIPPTDASAGIVPDDAGTLTPTRQFTDAGSLGAPDAGANVDGGTGDASPDDASAPPAPPPPRRVVFFHTPHGVVRGDWRPTGGRRDFVLSEILAPLEPFRDRLIVLDGIDVEVAPDVASWNTHLFGAAALLTGHVGERQGNEYTSGGPSIDYVIGRALGSSTPLGTIELGIFATPFGGRPSLLYGATADPRLPETDLRQAFQRLGLPLGADSQRLRDRIETLPADDFDNNSVPDRVGASFDLVATALRFDRTRVATIRVGDDAPVIRFTWLGHTYHWHMFPHRYGNPNPDLSSAESRRSLGAIWRWFAAQLAHFAMALDRTTVGSGSLLDHTIIVWLSETGDASSHRPTDIPVLILGGAGGALDTGQFLTADRSHVDLLLTIAHAAGVPLTSFGNPDVHAGAAPITELLAAPPP